MKYTYKTKVDRDVEAFMGFGCFFFIIAFVCAYVRHVVWVIGMLSAGDATVPQIILAVLGTLAPPFGIIHGFMLFLGYGM